VPLERLLSVVVVFDPRLDDPLNDSPPDDTDVGRKYCPRYASRIKAKSVANPRSVFAISRIKCVRFEINDEGVRGEMTGAVGERVMAEGKSGAGRFDRVGRTAESIPRSLAALAAGWEGSLAMPFNIGADGERMGRGGSSTSSRATWGECPVMA